MHHGTKSILKQAGFIKEVNFVEQGKCPLCGEDVDQTQFRDELSKVEFEQSGMCQGCQDRAFGKET